MGSGRLFRFGWLRVCGASEPASGQRRDKEKPRSVCGRAGRAAHPWCRRRIRQQVQGNASRSNRELTPHHNELRGREASVAALAKISVPRVDGIDRDQGRRGNMKPRPPKRAGPIRRTSMRNDGRRVCDPLRSHRRLSVARTQRGSTRASVQPTLPRKRPPMSKAA